MPEKETLERAEQDEREGKSASTQAGEFIREEMHHIREGKHGDRPFKSETRRRETTASEKGNNVIEDTRTGGA
jgi:hypothetical protein